MSPEVFWDHNKTSPGTLEGQNQCPDCFHMEEKCWKRENFETHATLDLQKYNNII